MTRTTLQTPLQFQIKSDMGLWRSCDYRVRFNWNPFRPVECIGGKVYFGTYYEVTVAEGDNPMPHIKTEAGQRLWAEAEGESDE